MSKHIHSLSKFGKKYRGHLFFAALFWGVWSYTWSDFYKASQETQKIRALTKVHARSIEHLNRFLLYKNCNNALPADLNLGLVARLHQKENAKSNLHFNMVHALPTISIASIEFTSSYLSGDKEILSNGFILTDRKSTKCFGVMY